MPSSELCGESVEVKRKSFVKNADLYTLYTAGLGCGFIQQFFIDSITTAYRPILVVYRQLNMYLVDLKPAALYSLSPGPLNKTNKKVIII